MTHQPQSSGPERKPQRTNQPDRTPVTVGESALPQASGLALQRSSQDLPPWLRQQMAANMVRQSGISNQAVVQTFQNVQRSGQDNPAKANQVKSWVQQDLRKILRENGQDPEFKSIDIEPDGDQFQINCVYTISNSPEAHLEHQWDTIVYVPLTTVTQEQWQNHLLAARGFGMLFAGFGAGSQSNEEKIATWAQQDLPAFMGEMWAAAGATMTRRIPSEDYALFVVKDVNISAASGGNTAVSFRWHFPNPGGRQPEGVQKTLIVPGGSPATLTHDQWQAFLDSQLADPRQKVQDLIDADAMEKAKQARFVEVEDWVREDLPDIADRIARSEYSSTGDEPAEVTAINHLDVTEEWHGGEPYTHVTYNIDFKYTGYILLGPLTKYYYKNGYQKTAQIPISVLNLTKNDWEIYKNFLLFPNTHSRGYDPVAPELALVDMENRTDDDWNRDKLEADIEEKHPGLLAKADAEADKQRRLPGKISEIRDWVRHYYELRSYDKVVVTERKNNDNETTTLWSFTIDGQPFEFLADPATDILELDESQVQATVKPKQFRKKYSRNNYDPATKAKDIEGWVQPTLIDLAKFIANRDLCSYGDYYYAYTYPDKHGIQTRNTSVNAESVYAEGRWWTYVTYTMDIRYPYDYADWGVIDLWKDGYTWTARLPVPMAEITKTDWEAAAYVWIMGESREDLESECHPNLKPLLEGAGVQSAYEPKNDKAEAKLDEIEGWVQADIDDIGDRIARRDYGGSSSTQAKTSTNSIDVVEVVSGTNRQTHVTYNINIEYLKPSNGGMRSRSRWKTTEGYQYTAQIPVPPDLMTKTDWEIYRESMFSNTPSVIADVNRGALLAEENWNQELLREQADLLS